MGAPTEQTTVIHVKVFERTIGSSNGQQQQQPLDRTRSGSVLAVSGGWCVMYLSIYIDLAATAQHESSEDHTKRALT